MLALDDLNSRNRRRVPLLEIDAIVAARLGPGRVAGNAQPAAFSRHIAMYMASQVGWSTTQIGKFYNGRDHSTVCSLVSCKMSLKGESVSHAR
jgi:chromosomal replication initiation ATPase DnaA